MTATAPRGGQRVRYDIGDIARRHGPSLPARATPRPEQRKALAAMAACRTAQLGGHLEVCSDCGDTRPSYNSCRNRHCPKCQGLAQERWINARQQRTLPTAHFHVVFTVPSELHALVAFHRRKLLSALMRCAAQTLLELGASRLQGARLGITEVLHTWTRDLRFHPHVHCIVTAGGLAQDGSWVPSRKDYLFPVAVMGALFRGKMLDTIRALKRCGDLDGFQDFADPQSYPSLMTKLAAKPWNTYCKQPFGSDQHVLRYLGRYTHRVGIANSRITYVDDAKVIFLTKNGATTSLTPVAFLERLLLHVLPPQFVKIRHYGLYAGTNVHGPLLAAQQALPRPDENKVDTLSTEPSTWCDLLLRLVDRDPRTCRLCGGQMLPAPLPTAVVRPRGQPPP